MTKPNRRYWKTRDIYLAAYLFTNGATIVGIEADEKKAVFSFLDSFDRENWTEKFHCGDAPVDAQTYVCALKTLKQKAIDALMESNG
jgi:hypothetical protein